MKSLLTSLLLLLPAMTVAQNYKMVWHDEFDVDGKPDPKTWTYEKGFVRNNEEQWYQGDNAEVRDGVLVITAKRDTVYNPYTKRATRTGARTTKRLSSPLALPRPTVSKACSTDAWR